MEYEEWRRSKEYYLRNPLYFDPVYGTPLKEPYKPSKKRGTVTYKGIPVVHHEKKEIAGGG